MGEVVGNSQNMEAAPETGSDFWTKDETSTRIAARWERVLQRMTLRVLLVEADDSTRQIIAALLRKCGYRVAAVPDGLKAWELIKGRPNNIDLILTEVDLPSISGFPLLTLIMEHDICKNIPVIMMSSQDAISTVYKCMTRGAADYLVKPIRRNELRNLWQHVWRRKFSTVGRNGPEEGVAQQKIEVSSENEAASNPSNGCIDDVYNEKGCDAQSSCTKPDVEAESPQMENMPESSQANIDRLFPGHLELQRDEIDINLCQKSIMHGIETGGSTLGTNENVTAEIAKTTSAKAKCCNTDPVYAGDAYCNANDVTLVSSSRNTTDLIGAFVDYPECNHRNSSSSNSTSNFNNASQLDLSLRRCHPSDFEDNLMTERHTLRQSNASAFSRYTNRPSQHLQHKFFGVFDEQNENGINPQKPVFDIAAGYASHNPDPRLSMQQSGVSPTSARSEQMKIATLSPPEKMVSAPIQVKSLRFKNTGSGYGSVLSPIFCAQAGLSPIPSPSTAAYSTSSFPRNSFYNSNLENNQCEKFSEPLHRNPNNAANQPREKQGQKLDSFEDNGHISWAADLSASSCFCNGAITNLGGLGYGNMSGSDLNDHFPIAMNIAERKNEVDLHSVKDLCRSTQREAALTKFRMKRKDRCYEKKVRYESRKKLAEQRPRVKGQFVRKLYVDAPPPETNGNYFHNGLA